MSAVAGSAEVRWIVYEPFPLQQQSLQWVAIGSPSFQPQTVWRFSDEIDADVHAKTLAEAGRTVYVCKAVRRVGPAKEVKVVEVSL